MKNILLIKYIHLFKTNSEFTEAYNGPDYVEPWLSLTEETMTIGTSKPKLTDFSTEPLTFNILSAGTINWTASNTDITKTIDYKLNDGEWTSITSNTGSLAPSITVNSGDKLQFRGNNEQYGGIGSQDVLCNSFSGSTASFEAEGNIMSLIYGDNFTNNLTISGEFAFAGLFKDSTKLVSAENLILPANTLATGCYSGMFVGCTSLTAAPELPATSLATGCYSRMFENCTNLNYIKCLATDISAYGSKSSWVSGVAATGTFVKSSSMTSWSTGTSGIPEGWTVQDA